MHAWIKIAIFLNKVKHEHYILIKYKFCLFVSTSRHCEIYCYWHIMRQILTIF